MDPAAADALLEDGVGHLCGARARITLGRCSRENDFTARDLAPWWCSPFHAPLYIYCRKSPRKYAGWCISELTHREPEDELDSLARVGEQRVQGLRLRGHLGKNRGADGGASTVPRGSAWPCAISRRGRTCGIVRGKPSRMKPPAPAVERSSQPGSV